MGLISSKTDFSQLIAYGIYDLSVEPSSEIARYPNLHPLFQKTVVTYTPNFLTFLDPTTKIFRKYSTMYDTGERKYEQNFHVLLKNTRYILGKALKLFFFGGEGTSRHEGFLGVLDFASSEAFFFKGEGYYSSSLGNFLSSYSAGIFLRSSVVSMPYTSGGAPRVCHKPGFLEYSPKNFAVVFGVSSLAGTSVAVVWPFSTATNYASLQSVLLTSSRTMEAMATDGKGLFYKFSSRPHLHIIANAAGSLDFNLDGGLKVDLSSLSGIHQAGNWSSPIDANSEAVAIAAKRSAAFVHVLVALENQGVLHLVFDKNWNLTHYARIVGNVGISEQAHIKPVVPFEGMAVRDVAFVENDLLLCWDKGAVRLSFTQNANGTLSYSLVKAFQNGIVDVGGDMWFSEDVRRVEVSGSSFAIATDSFVWSECEEEELPAPVASVIATGSSFAVIRASFGKNSKFVKAYVKISEDGTSFSDAEEVLLEEPVVTVKVSGLSPNKDYQAMVVAETVTGIQRNSNVVSFRTAHALPTPSFDLKLHKETGAVLVSLEEVKDDRLEIAEIWAGNTSGDLKRIGYVSLKAKSKLYESGKAGSKEITLEKPVPLEFCEGAVISIETVVSYDTDQDGVPDTNVVFRDEHEIEEISYLTGAVKLKTPLANYHAPGATVTLKSPAFLDKSTITGLTRVYKVRLVNTYGEYSESQEKVIFVDEKPYDWHLSVHTEGWQAVANLEYVASKNPTLEFKDDKLFPKAGNFYAEMSELYLFGERMYGAMYPSNSNFTRDNKGLRVAKLSGASASEALVKRALLFNELENMVYNSLAATLEPINTSAPYGFTHKNSFSQPVLVQKAKITCQISSFTHTLRSSSAVPGITYTIGENTRNTLNEHYVVVRSYTDRYGRINEFGISAGTTVTVRFPEPAFVFGFRAPSGVSVSFFKEGASATLPGFVDRAVLTFNVAVVSPVVEFDVAIGKLVMKAYGLASNLDSFVVEKTIVVGAEQEFELSVERNVLEYNFEVKVLPACGFIESLIAQGAKLPTVVVSAIDPGYPVESELAPSLKPYIVVTLPFSFAAINNFVVRVSDTDYVVGDVKVGQLKWLFSVDGGKAWYTFKNGAWTRVSPSFAAPLGMTTGELEKLDAGKVDLLVKTVKAQRYQIALLCAFDTPSPASSPYLHAIEYYAAYDSPYPREIEFELPVFYTAKFTKLYDIVFVADTPREPATNLSTEAFLYYSYSLDCGVTWSDWILWDEDRAKLEEIPFWQHKHSVLLRFKVVLRNRTIPASVRKVAFFFMDLDNVPRIVKPAVGEPIIDNTLDLIFVSPENLTGGTVQFAIEVATDPDFKNVILRAKSFSESRKPFENFRTAPFYFCSSYIPGTNPNDYVWIQTGSATPGSAGVPGVHGAPADGRTFVRFRHDFGAAASSTYYIRIYSWDGTIGA